MSLSIPAPVVWAGFIALVLGLLTIDLRVSAHHPEGLTPKRALHWSLFWIGLSVAFGLGIFWVDGADRAAQFFTGYLLEKTLSVDNLFLFILIFHKLEVPEALQHRVLSWGILGALVLRAIMILAGIQILHAWHPIIYVFGGFLILTGLRTLLSSHKAKDIEKNRTLRLAQRTVPFVARYEGGRFFTHENGRRVGTMLLLVLVVIEATDVIFAVDSIPAVLAVTDDAFIVFSSNILAVLGLRALFFAVAPLLERLRYLRYGLGVILLLIGGKMCLSDVVKVPPLASLGMTLGILAITVAASLWRSRR